MMLLLMLIIDTMQSPKYWSNIAVNLHQVGHLGFLPRFVSSLLICPNIHWCLPLDYSLQLQIMLSENIAMVELVGSLKVHFNPNV